MDNKNEFFVMHPEVYTSMIKGCALQYEKVLERMIYLEKENKQLKEDNGQLQSNHKDQLQIAEDLYVNAKMELEKTTAILNAYKKRLSYVNGEEHNIVKYGEDYVDIVFKKQDENKIQAFPIEYEKCKLCQNEWCSTDPRYNICKIKRKNCWSNEYGEYRPSHSECHQNNISCTM